jgi:hypothetical protein
VIVCFADRTQGGSHLRGDRVFAVGGRGNSCPLGDRTQAGQPLVAATPRHEIFALGWNANNLAPILFNVEASIGMKASFFAVSRLLAHHLLPSFALG